MLGVACWLLGVGYANAQSSYQIGMGSTHILDTYLTQEKFKGTGITFLNVNEHANPDANWSTVWQHQINLSQVKDRSEDCS